MDFVIRWAAIEYILHVEVQGLIMMVRTVGQPAPDAHGRRNIAIHAIELPPGSFSLISTEMYSFFNEII